VTPTATRRRRRSAAQTRRRTRRADQFSYERRLQHLEAVYTAAQETLAANIKAALRSSEPWTAQRVQLQLAAVVAVLDGLDITVTPLARELVRDAYQQGADRMLEQIGRLSIVTPEIPGAFVGVQSGAVEALQRSLLDRLDSARQTLGRRVEDVYAREQRSAAIRSLLGVDGSPRTAANELQQRLLRNRGVEQLVRDSSVGFVDSAGKRWQLNTYTRMAVRTVTREAVVQGAIARMAAHGIDLARVSNHATDCPVCQPWEGQLISLSGSIDEYQGESVITGDTPPFHPNCRHSLQPVATRVEAVARDLAGGA
jgi:hypothetical protein